MSTHDGVGVHKPEIGHVQALGTISADLKPEKQIVPISAKDHAKELIKSYGWGSEQWECLDKLWTKESGWRVNADNPSSSAYGIPQALPGSKMASVGNDWQTNPRTQIKWGTQYLKDRYGSACGGWQHSQANNWY
jgi:hypothetical protein